MSLLEEVFEKVNAVKDVLEEKRSKKRSLEPVLSTAQMVHQVQCSVIDSIVRSLNNSPHLKFFSSGCVKIWLFNSAFVMNLKSHKPHS